MRYLFSLFVVTVFYSFVIQTDTTAKFISTSISQYGEIQFKVLSKKSDHYAFELEKMENGKWVNASSISIQSSYIIGGGPPARIQKGAMIDTMTSQLIVKFHKGINEYRIKMNFPEKAVSEPFVLNAESSNEGQDLWILHDSIRLEESTYYEVLNSVGGTVSKGEAKIIGIKQLQAGKYFLYTKSRTRTFLVE